MKEISSRSEISGAQASRLISLLRRYDSFHEPGNVDLGMNMNLKDWGLEYGEPNQIQDHIRAYLLTR